MGIPDVNHCSGVKTDGNSVQYKKLRNTPHTVRVGFNERWFKMMVRGNVTITPPRSEVKCPAPGVAARPYHPTGTSLLSQRGLIF